MSLYELLIQVSKLILFCNCLTLVGIKSFFDDYPRLSLSKGQMKT